MSPWAYVEQTHSSAATQLQIHYRGEVFRADRAGTWALRVDHKQGVDFDLSAAVSTLARSDDNRACEGMTKLASTVEIGPSLRFGLAPCSGWRPGLRLPAHAVFTVKREPAPIGWTANREIPLATDLRGWALAFQGGSSSGRPGRVATVTASSRRGDLWIGTCAQPDSLCGAVFETSRLARPRLHVRYGLGLSWLFKASSARARDGS